jgi:hypothetical protein
MKTSRPSPSQIGRARYTLPGCTAAMSDAERWGININVLDLGAIGDGVADSTAAVVAAITKAHSAGGGTVIIPNGTYSVGGVILTGINNVKITGDGTIVKRGANGVFWFISCSNIEIYGLRIDGQITADEAAAGRIRPAPSTRSGSDYAYAVIFDKCTDCSVSNCRVFDFAWDALRAEGDISVDGTTCTFSTGIKFTDNTVYGIRNTAIWVRGLKDFVISGNYGPNADDFDSGGNFIYCVEWCVNGSIQDNHCINVGDNAIGLGQVIHTAIPTTSPALNTHIVVTGNVIDTTRYHAILIAGCRNVIVARNVVKRAGAKDAMPGVSGSFICAAIYLLSGYDGEDSDPRNENISIYNNDIDRAYEAGIWVLERNGTSLADASRGINISHNNISNTATDTLATRLTAESIHIQCQIAPRVQNNLIQDCVGSGVIVAGDAIVQNNTVYNLSTFGADDGYGIYVQSDTVNLNKNLRLSGAISGNTIISTPRTGILVWDRHDATITGNTCKNCGINPTVPETQWIATSVIQSGIGVAFVRRSVISDNYTEGCGANGISGYLSQYESADPVVAVVNGRGNRCVDNGTVFTDSWSRCGIMLQGSETCNVKGTLTDTTCVAGTHQQYPILAYRGTFISLDEIVDTHGTGQTTFATVKQTASI